jgi:signal recognition particle receptor subunit beta
MQALSELLDPYSENQKIVQVTGPYPSGKSRFVASLTGQSPVKVETSSYTGYPYTCELSSLKFGDTNCLNLLTWPGPARFDQLKSFIAGSIVIFDLSRPETFLAARAIQQNYKAFGLPIVIAGNLVDSMDAWELSDLRVYMRLSEQDVLVACNVEQYRSTADVTLKLTEQLPQTDFVKQLEVKLRSTPAT